MAVVSVKWQGHLSRSGEQPDGAATAEEYFAIVCDADTDTTAVQGAADPTTGLRAPTYGYAHPTTGALYCNTTEYTPMQQNTRRVFQCRAMYTDQFEQNPLTAPPAIAWDFSEDGETPFFIDCTPSSVTGPNGQPGPQPVLNTAGERFQDFLTRKGGTITATFAVNLAPSAAASMAQTLVAYLYPVPATNSTAITFDGLSVSVGQVLMLGANITDLQKTKIYGTLVQYRTVTFKLAFKNVWTYTVDDRGFNQKATVGSNTSLQPVPVNPAVAMSPGGWPLDGHGKAKPNITDAPAPLTFYPYPQMTYAPFNFS